MIRSFLNHIPVVPSSCYIFDTANIIGNVTLGENCLVYAGAMIRAEREHISIGDNTNIQENACIHIEDDHDVIIGSQVTIGHNAIVHACTIADWCLIGMGAIIQDGAVIEENCFIGAGALIPRNFRVPAGHMAYGFPARVVRPITQAEYDEIRLSTIQYQGYRMEFMRQDGR